VAEPSLRDLASGLPLLLPGIRLMSKGNMKEATDIAETKMTFSVRLSTTTPPVVNPSLKPNRGSHANRPVSSKPASQPASRPISNDTAVVWHYAVRAKRQAAVAAHGAPLVVVEIAQGVEQGIDPQVDRLRALHRLPA
jgi:hypothetical protein